MDILVWSGLGNSDYLGKMMSFSNIYLYFWLKRKKRYIPCLYRVCLYVILMDYGFMTNIIDNMLSLCPGF